MKIREEDFDINEGLERYQNDKRIEKDEKYLRANPETLRAILNAGLDELFVGPAIKLESIIQINDINLKGEFLGKKEHISKIEDYPAGYIELIVNLNRVPTNEYVLNETLTFRWADDYYSYSS